jgi:hypothetical protein
VQDEVTLESLESEDGGWIHFDKSETAPFEGANYTERTRTWTLDDGTTVGFHWDCTDNGADDINLLLTLHGEIYPGGQESFTAKICDMGEFLAVEGPANSPLGTNNTQVLGYLELRSR